MTRNAKHTIPAYGCLVAINTITASIDRPIRVTVPRHFEVAAYCKNTAN